MRVILEVLSGPDAGRRTLLGAGQALRVGRTQRADLCLPHDKRLSGVHFALETDAMACYVEDLGSSNGTLLNGERLAERAVLRNGDQLQAGKTAFLVRTEGDSPDEAAMAAATASHAAPLSEPATNPAGVSYTVEACDSGLTLCRGSIEALDPGALAAALSQRCPAWWIVDFHKLDGGVPEGLKSPSYLFDWLEPSVAQFVSPMLLGPDEVPELAALIQSAWGCDALVCLFSRQEKPALLAHLQRSLRVKPERKGPPEGIVGYCWPSVLAPLLSHYTPEYVAKLLEGIEAVLVEFPDLPLTWQVFGQADVTELLDQTGLVQEPADDETSDTTTDAQ